MFFSGVREVSLHFDHKGFLSQDEVDLIYRDFWQDNLNIARYILSEEIDPDNINVWAPSREPEIRPGDKYLARILDIDDIREADIVNVDGLGFEYSAKNGSTQYQAFGPYARGVVITDSGRIYTGKEFLRQLRDLELEL